MLQLLSLFSVRRIGFLVLACGVLTVGLPVQAFAAYTQTTHHQIIAEDFPCAHHDCACKDADYCHLHCCCFPKKTDEHGEAKNNQLSKKAKWLSCFGQEQDPKRVQDPHVDMQAVSGPKNYVFSTPTRKVFPEKIPVLNHTPGVPEKVPIALS